MKKTSNLINFDTSQIIDLETISNFPKESYSAITRDVFISVFPEFIFNKIIKDVEIFVWAYHIKIDNKRDEPIRLLEREWKVIDENGSVQESSENDFPEEEKVVKPHRSLSYTRVIHLASPSGIMSGSYRIKKSDGEIIEAKVPSFSLDSENQNSVVN